MDIYIQTNNYLVKNTQLSWDFIGVVYTSVRCRKISVKFEKIKSKLFRELANLNKNQRP